MSRTRPFQFRAGYDTGSSTLSFRTRDDLLAHVAESLRRNEAKASKGFQSHQNLSYDEVACPVDRDNPNTPLARFNKLVEKGDAVMHGNVFSDTQSSSYINAPVQNSYDELMIAKLLKDLPPAALADWRSQMAKVDVPTLFVITKVAARISATDELSVVHGWTLGTADGKCLESASSNNHPASAEIMKFYTQALYFGDWTVKERLVDMKNGVLEYVHPEVRTLADALPEPYLWEEHESMAADIAPSFSA